MIDVLNFLDLFFNFLPVKASTRPWVANEALFLVPLRCISAACRDEPGFWIVHPLTSFTSFYLPRPLEYDDGFGVFAQWDESHSTMWPFNTDANAAGFQHIPSLPFI